MNTKAIIELAAQLDRARAAREKLRTEEAALRMQAGQNCVSISCMGRTIAITSLSRETNYMPQPVRGMQMIQLGLLKWYSAQAERADSEVRQLEEDLRNATGATHA